MKFGNKQNILFVDNGGYEIKFYSNNMNNKPQVLQNCKFCDKNFNYDSAFFLDDISNESNYFSIMNKSYVRPLSRGLLSDIDLQIEIWEHMFSKAYRIDQFNPENILFMFTHIPLLPDNIVETYFQILFEYFGFHSIIKSIPQVFQSYYLSSKHHNMDSRVQLLIDSGFSSTNIVPMFEHRPIYNAIRRIDIGGKLLTNFMKDSLANLCDLDLRKEFFLVNMVKEEQCFVSLDFNKDIKTSSSKHNEIRSEFILPEYRNIDQEKLKKLPKERYTIEMNSLRFITPELLFNPNIIGINQGGLIDGINQSIKACNPDFSSLLYENIALSGGNISFPNFKQRLTNDLIPNSPCDNKIKIYNENFNKFSVIDGMRLFAENESAVKEFTLTKDDYNELGINLIWKNCI